MLQVLIRWGLRHGTSVLAKSVSAARIRSNLDVIHWDMDDESFEQLSSIPTHVRMVNGNFLVNPRGPYSTLQDLWDDS